MANLSKMWEIIEISSETLKETKYEKAEDSIWGETLRLWNMIFPFES